MAPSIPTQGIYRVSIEEVVLLPKRCNTQTDLAVQVFVPRKVWDRPAKGIVRPFVCALRTQTIAVQTSM